MSTINSEQPLSMHPDPNHTSWILDLNSNCDGDDINMDIDSDIVTVVSSTETNHTTYDTMDMEQETDVALLLKRAIGAERRQKSSTENFISNDHHTTMTNDHLSETATFEETEQFFHDLCAELTSTTASLVSSSSSSTNALRCTAASPEQTLIH